jgi:hypothetical protein
MRFPDWTFLVEVTCFAASLLSVFCSDAPFWIKLSLILLPIILCPIIPRKKEDSMEVGNENVIINAPYVQKAADRNTIVGATDPFQNCKFTQPIAIGYGAKAGPNSIAIGVNAGAGIHPTHTSSPTTPAE